MQLIWHGYACSMTEMDPTTFRICACPTKPSSPHLPNAAINSSFQL
jgi:hypothetical protein